MIRIRSHEDGFRRAGMAHPATWKEYPDDTFTEKQLATLKAEPMLQVEEVEGDPKTPVGSDTDTALPKFADITVDQIKARLDNAEVSYEGNALKAELYGLLESVLKKARD
ncbi:HI1506-related protein [uncultured Pseudodesulfovibrio sp.]|uniref:HI1506-related protein n=1 Tax=uncultured Pseudodesulfovibrio sp. TaxID=2035858 RepID=UPI0029C90497|nr:HI1506-related protein [uncultured Pseudodesulfovibrio sp.]